MQAHVRNMLRTQPSQTVRGLLREPLPALSASMLLLSRVRLAARMSDRSQGSQRMRNTIWLRMPCWGEHA